jgi:DNA-binding winged helix-turn-helix (wHTH) protein
MSVDQPRPPIRVGEWIADPALDTITRGGEAQKLEPRTMRLLMCLADSAGTVVSIERLLDDVWAGVIVSPASVYQAVSQLRRILGDTHRDPTYIATVPRRGYRLIATLAPLDAANPDVTASPPGAMIAPATTDALSRRWRLASIAVLPFIDMTGEKNGDHMRVTVQLVDAQSGYRLWSATYDRAIADTIKMQEDISRSVAEALAIHLMTDMAKRFASRRSESPQASQFYLRARHDRRSAQYNPTIARCNYIGKR